MYAIRSYYEAGLSCTIRGITTAEYPTPAKRPAYSVMTKVKVKQVFGISIPEWMDSLRKVIRDF